MIYALMIPGTLVDVHSYWMAVPDEVLRVPMGLVMVMRNDSQEHCWMTRLMIRVRKK